MVKHILCLLFLFTISYSCKEAKSNPLRKLTRNEIVQKAKNSEVFNLKGVNYKNEKGVIIDKDEFVSFSKSIDWTVDRYSNDSGEIVELKLRKSTEVDRSFDKGLSDFYKRNKPIDVIDINCNKIQSYLDEIYDLDQNMRIAGDINIATDRRNIIVIVSIIEKCGMPTLSQVNQKQLNTIWLVLQHTENFIRKKYFPILKNSCENGDLSKSKIAMMQDRILMNEGKPQIYGTQITTDIKTHKLKLYNLTKPETVNKRRKEVGLGPIQEYLKNWDLIFETNQN